MADIVRLSRYTKSRQPIFGSEKVKTDRMQPNLVLSLGWMKPLMNIMAMVRATMRDRDLMQMPWNSHHEEARNRTR
jgi:plasmid maintenance system killer protein